MIKMVVSSFYNTLIDKEEAIPTSTMLEIDRIRNQGTKFTICTNRTYQEVMDYNKDFPFIDYIISLNGSYIYDVEKSRCIFKKKLSLSNIKRVLAETEGYKKKYYSSEEVLDTFQEKERKDIYKIEIELKGEEDPLLEKVKKWNMNTSTILMDNKLLLECTSCNSSVFLAVDQISLKNNFTLKDIVAICANESETSLVKNIKRSFIMENSSKKLKELTKKRTKSNTEKGVEFILKKIK